MAKKNTKTKKSTKAKKSAKTKKSTKAVKSTKASITEKALILLEQNQNGISYSELVKLIRKDNPTMKVNTIRGNIWRLGQEESNEVYKPIKGLFRLKKFKTTDEVSEPTEEETSKKGTEETDARAVKEEDFYEPFAFWLTNETEDTTIAIPLGGSAFKDKWGTPDVIGIYEFKKRDIIKPIVEVVTAEIKFDSNQLITAFGQACAYKLFSHKVYLVIPKQTRNEDIFKLKSLCQIFGIGLVKFDKESPDNPEFDVITHPIRNDPDYYYTNQIIRSSDIILRKLFPRY